MKIDCKGRSWPAYENVFEEAIKIAAPDKPVYVTREGVLKKTVRGLEKQLGNYWIVYPDTHRYGRESWAIFVNPDFR